MHAGPPTFCLPLFFLSPPRLFFFSDIAAIARTVCRPMWIVQPWWLALWSPLSLSPPFFFSFFFFSGPCYCCPHYKARHHGRAPTDRRWPGIYSVSRLLCLFLFSLEQGGGREQGGGENMCKINRTALSLLSPSLFFLSPLSRPRSRLFRAVEV